MIPMICPVIVEVEAKSLSESPEIINEHLIQLVTSDNNDMPVFAEVEVKLLERVLQ